VITGRPRHRAGFSLLETVVALAMLAAAAVVCFDMRAQGMVRARRLQEAARSEEAIRTLIDLAQAGLFPGAVGPAEGDPSRRVEWRGVHDGRPYEVVRDRVLAPNPVVTMSAAAPAPAFVALERIVVKHGERVESVLTRSSP